MCPVCLATAAMIAGGAAGSGGLTALTIGLFRRKSVTDRFPEPVNEKEVHHADEHDCSGSFESGIGQ